MVVGGGSTEPLEIIGETPRKTVEGGECKMGHGGLIELRVKYQCPNVQGLLISENFSSLSKRMLQSI